MRRTLDEKNIRKILKRGGSYAITIPIEAIRDLKWKNGQKVIVERDRGRIIIRDWRK